MKPTIVVAAMLIAGLTASPPAPALAQTTSDAAGAVQTISAMTDAEIVEALKTSGRVSMSGTFFEHDSAKLTPLAGEELAKLKRSLDQMPDARLAVVGHTDSTGNFEYNINLSERRAQAVVDSLTGAPFSIEAIRLVAVGVGPVDPIASNLSDDGKAQNRRVSLVLVGEAKSGAAVSTTATVASDSGGWLKDPVTGCSIWTSGNPVAGEGASWTGACQNGKASGHGTLVFWDEKGQEARYSGEVFAGRVHGAGKLSLRDEKDGGFDSYAGHFRNGEPHGEGVLVSGDGYRFEGELLNGISHGRGKLTTPEGWEIKGEIKDGKTVGEATAYYEDANKDLYFGQIENSKRHGFGTLMMASEDTYVGEFVEGDPYGPGMFEAANGSQYLGIFAKGSPNGAGTFIDVDGTSYQGRFVDGIADGMVLVTKQDGTQEFETWKNGVVVE